ncbi:MAG: SpoVG family protein [Thermodesulfobacteriota bacterium]
MQISEVKILLVDGDEVLKAYVSIKIDGALVIRDMKVIKGSNGYFVAMPAKKMKDGTYWDLVHPLDSKTREMLEERVLDEYKRVAKEAEKDGGNEVDEETA